MAIKGLSKVIHELQSSLTSVRSLSEILQDYPNINSTKRSEFLEIIIQEAERMTSVIQQAETPMQTVSEVGIEVQNTNLSI
jgi:signal transduction histidine kinase